MRWLQLPLVAVAFTGAYLFASGKVGVSVDVDWPAAGPTYQPRVRSVDGEELVLVYIGASSCGPSNAAELPGVLEGVKVALRAQARARGRQLLVIGVAKDAVAAKGLAHLRKFGDFDEVATGNGWFNTAALHYNVERFPGLAATPQVVLTSRAIRDTGGHHEIANERLLLRKVGLSEITMWLQRGAPVPIEPRGTGAPE